MESRKVQRVGRSTLSVSLPIEWVKEVGLDQSDVITFERNPDSSLTIKTIKSEQEPHIVEYLINADLCNESGMLERIIVGNYVLGRDTLRIFSAKRISDEHVREVRRIIHRLLGIGIIEETSNQILLQCSIDVSRFPVNSLIRRLYIIASTMHKEVMQALEQLDPTLANEAFYREEEADMLYWLLIRLIMSAQRDRRIALKIGLEEPLHILGSRIIATQLERIADWGAIMAQNIIQIKEYKKDLQSDKGREITKKILELGRKADEICYKAMGTIYGGDIKICNSIIEVYKRQAESLEEEIADRITQQDFSSSISPRLRAIAWGMRRIAELGSELSQVAINRSLETDTNYCKEHIVKEVH